MDPLVLDHVGIAVTDLDAGEAAYTKLGFALTPRSVHEGRATGNHCAMLETGYLEVLGIARPETETSFERLIERYEGLHIVAFGCGDTDEAYPVLRARCRGLKPAVLLERDAQFGPDGSETRRASFRNIYTDETEFPEAKFIFIEHQTPEVLWQPHLLTHPNGAVGLHEVAICAPDVERTADRLAEALGAPAEPKGDGIRLLTLGRGQVYILAPDVVPKWCKGVTPPNVPSVVGFGVTVRDLDTTRAHLDAQRVPYNAHPYPAIWVDPTHARGVTVSFIQA